MRESEQLNLSLVVDHDGTRPTCRARGEIDVATASVVATTLSSFLEVGEAEIDLDLSDVTFIDSRGIHELVRAHKAGLRIFITNASPVVRRVLDLVHIEPRLRE